MADEELAEVQRSLGRIEGHLQFLVGNGQPGLIQKMRDDIEGLKTARNYIIGFGAGLTFVEGAYHYLLNKIGLR